jgi:uncharacterized DUF497 family protein
VIFGAWAVPAGDNNATTSLTNVMTNANISRMNEGLAGIEWDDGNWPKCAKYGVSRAEVEQVLTGDVFVLPDRSGNMTEARFNAVGQNTQGRYVFIVFAFRQRGVVRFIRPISARYMHAKEALTYERQK